MSTHSLTTLLIALVVFVGASAPSPQAQLYFLPSNPIIHDVDVGNSCDPLVCKISEQNGAHLQSTMFTFTYPPAVLGKTCYLGLPLGPSAELYGSQQIDVFRMWSPVTSCPSYGNNRDLELGRMNLFAGGNATWAWTSYSYLTQPTKCPVPGTVEGIEFAPVSDATGNDWVVWVQGVESGPRIYYY